MQRANDADRILIQETIKRLCHERGPSKTICPSEVIRLLYPGDWRNHMQTVRDVAFKMAAEGLIEVTKGGNAVPPESARGPIRLRMLSTET